MKRRGVAMQPKGTDLLATLINLLAEQEGVKIDFEFEKVSVKTNE